MNDLATRTYSPTSQMQSIDPIAWTDLQVGKTYNVQTTCVDTTLKPFVLKEIIMFPEIEGRSQEAMLIATNGDGYAVGGIFDQPGGPMNMFFPFPSSAEQTDFPNAVVASVLEDIVSLVEEKEQEQPESLPPFHNDYYQTDFSMAYGLRRCRLCGYNEGPLPCPSDCYKMAVPTPTPSSFEETGQ